MGWFGEKVVNRTAGGSRRTRAAEQQRKLLGAGNREELWDDTEATHPSNEHAERLHPSIRVQPHIRTSRR